ncbi:MAG: hypothetical protein QOE55_7671, partial [Acidobacteriaceae bacterium]|nr:hypothetical protein [Acidobacteriaceae bacterium]
MKMGLKAACERAGISHRHGVCFQSTANYTDSVIACRSVGRAVGGLLEESYSSKPFNLKAKTCDWGPMAGFVLSDFRFARRGSSPHAFRSQTDEDHSPQRRDSHSSIASGHAGQIPITISETRKKWLIEKGYMDVTTASGNMYFVSASSSDTGNHSKFVLQRDDTHPAADGSILWGLYYGGSPGMPSIAGSSPDVMRRQI